MTQVDPGGLPPDSEERQDARHEGREEEPNDGSCKFKVVFEVLEALLTARTSGVMDWGRTLRLYGSRTTSAQVCNALWDSTCLAMSTRGRDYCSPIACLQWRSCGKSTAWWWSHPQWGSRLLPERNSAAESDTAHTQA